jgi:hypothetical protein
MVHVAQQMTLAYSQGVVNDTYARYMPGAQFVWSSLGEYFNVNNQYVMRKLYRLVLPFFQKKWARQTMVDVQGHARGGGDAGGGGGGGALGGTLAPPAWDENAPDLYIPSMAFITYVLCMGLVKGVIRDFHPDVLVAVATSTLAVQGMEVLLLKGALQVFAPDAQLQMVRRGPVIRPFPPPFSPPLSSLPFFSHSPPSHTRKPAPQFDLVAYSGYMYFSLVINSLSGLLFGSGPYLAFLVYTGAAGAFFLFRSLSPLVRQEGSVPAAGGADAKKKWLLLAVGALNFALLWWLGPSYAAAATGAAAAGSKK